MYTALTLPVSLTCDSTIIVRTRQSTEMSIEQTSANGVTGIAWCRVTRATARLFARHTRPPEEERRLRCDLGHRSELDSSYSNKALVARGERGWDYHKLTERAC
jgi:hypothetical protein